METPERTERFVRQMEGLRIDDPAPGRHNVWLRVGVAAMVVGVVCCVVAVVRSQGTTDALVQRDSLALGLTGVALSVVGTGVYLRFAITKVLRFWLARLTFEISDRTDTTEEQQS